MIQILSLERHGFVDTISFLHTHTHTHFYTEEKGNILFNYFFKKITLISKQKFIK